MGHLELISEKEPMNRLGWERGTGSSTLISVFGKLKETEENVINYKKHIDG